MRLSKRRKKQFYPDFMYETGGRHMIYNILLILGFIVIFSIIGGIAFGKVPFLPIGMGESKIDTVEQEIEKDEEYYEMVEHYLDLMKVKPATQCFQILINFQDGWLDNMFKMKDSIEIICPNMIDVRIEYEGIIQDYTMEEFLKRLGFKEK